MTEEEWRASEDPKRMLEFILGNASDRKLRLFAVGCCMRVWSKIRWEKTRQVILAAELYADGLLSEDAAAAARQAAHAESERQASKASGTDLQLCVAAMGALLGFVKDFWGVGIAQQGSFQVSDDYPAEWNAQSGMLRCVFGNPFQPVAVESSWLTSTVIALAEGIYQDRDFSPMPILADALQDAGCDNEDILNHLRDTNATHVRGCWALDLVLGKE